MANRRIGAAPNAEEYAEIVVVDKLTGAPVFSAGGSAGNAAAGATGSAVPASGDYQAVNVGGTLRGQTGVNYTGTQYAADTNIAAIAGVQTTTAGLPIQPGILPTATNRSGTATTTSGGLSVAANTSRRGLVGQNISGGNIGFNEFGGTAAIGTAGTYTVAAGGSFSISTQNLVNFVTAAGTAAVTMTEY